MLTVYLTWQLQRIPVCNFFSYCGSNNFHYIYLILIIANIILSLKDFMYGKQTLFVRPLEEEKYLINTSLLVMRHFQTLIRCLVHIQVGDWANGKILLTFGYLILDIR
jgi:hypothetical protein